MTVETSPPPPAPGPDPGPPRDLYPPLAYHETHRAGERGWWRPVLGVLLVAAAMMIVGPLVWLVPFLGYYVATGAPVGESVTTLLDLGDLTPAGLAYINLALASLIPAAWLVTRAVHGLRPRWLTSIAPRMRWGYFAACFGLAIVALMAMLLIAAVMPSGTTGAELSGEANEFTRTTRDFLLVILLLTPLQAAGEEYGFRGYLTQVVGGILGGAAGRIAAVAVPALLFALAHGVGQSVPVFFDRFAFGIVAGVLVIATGGLEAAIAMHVLNNWLAFGLALAFGDLSSAMNPGEGSWWSIPVTLTQSLVYLGLALWAARAMGLARRSDPAALIASRGRVYRGVPVPHASA